MRSGRPRDPSTLIPAESSSGKQLAVASGTASVVPILDAIIIRRISECATAMGISNPPRLILWQRQRRRRRRRGEGGKNIFYLPGKLSGLINIYL
jgi:hypothetical protein